MTAKHTPGPWVLEVDEDEGVIRLRMGTALDEDAFAWDAPHLIELEFDPTARKTWEEAIANMRLMSAAPDLLAAVKEAVEIIQDFADSLCGCGYVDSPCRVCYAAAKFKDVIAKACGEDAG